MKPAYKRAALGAIVALGMLGVVPGVTFAAAPACGDTIMSNVTLHADLDCSSATSDGITFGKKGLTLNLNGYTIWGPDGDDNYSGINTNNKKNPTVKNGTLDGWDTAVYGYASIGGAYKNLKIKDTAGDETYDEGVYVYYGANNVVDNNTCWDIGYCVDVEYGGGNWVTNNTANDGYDSFYSYYEQDDHFSGNTAMGYSDDGFYDYASGNATYNGNTADADGNGGSIGFYMYCDSYAGITFKNNSATDNSSYGIEIYECYDDYGYDNFQDSIISGNVSNDNGGYGFYDYYSLQAHYLNNTAKRNGGYGFYMDYPGGQIFNGNVANKNGSDGVFFDDMGYGYYGNPKSVSNNTANGNSGYGIVADYGVPNASGNRAHNNSSSPQCWNVLCN